MISLSRSFQGSSVQGGFGLLVIHIAHNGLLLFFIFPANCVTLSSLKHKHTQTLSYSRPREQG